MAAKKKKAAPKKKVTKAKISASLAKKLVKRALKDGVVITNKSGKGWKTKRAQGVAWLKKQPDERKTTKGTLGVYWSLDNFKILAAAFAKDKAGAPLVARKKRPQSPYSVGRRRAQKSSKKSATGAVMGHKTKIFVVLKKVGDKPETVMGAYPSKTAAKIAGRNLLASIAKAYNPFIPSSVGAEKTTPARGKHFAIGRLQVGTWPKGKDTLKIKNTGGSGKALDYLLDTGVLEKSKKKNIEVKIVTVNLNGNNEKDKKYRAYFELYNSPVYGNLRWNPKKRRR